jgi:glycosyltransferase involved in cell wall biosynthesis
VLRQLTGIEGFGRIGAPVKIAIVCADHAVEWHQQFCAALTAHGHAATAYPRPASAGPVTTTSPRELLPFVGEWAADLGRLWASDPPEVVHAIGWIGGLAAQLAARRLDLPTVQSCHGLASATDPDDTERARLEPLLVRNATWATGGSSDELDALTKLRRKRSHLSLLSTGVDTERFKGTGPKLGGSGQYRVLQVEPNAMPCNGFDRTIQALPKLPGTELVLATTAAASGRCEGDEAEIRRLAARAGVSDRVRIVSNVVPEELPSLLRSADVVACTSRQVPQATTALQAMASGVAVVGVAAGALTDLVIHGVTGLLVSPTNPHELASALKTLQTEHFLRHSMGSAGRCRALSRFTWDRIALDALNIYQQTCWPQPPQRRRTAARAKNSAIA